MKVLISPISLEEARVVIEGGCDILDLKNVKEGSLGAQPPWMLKSIVEALGGRGVMLSATLGDLPYKPGTAGLAAFGCASCGVDYVKAGLHGATNLDQAREMMTSVVKSVRMVSDDIIAVASGYADWKRFGGVAHLDIVRAAHDSGADVAMLDTFIKDGKNLFDSLTENDLREFTELAHSYGMLVALAGSVKREHIATLARVGCDIVGVRGAVCSQGDRTTGITRDAVLEFMKHSREIAPENGVPVKPRSKPLKAEQAV
jgi:(5-formylfuran-3-yl)methyl phosphate synthase